MRPYVPLLLPVNDVLLLHTAVQALHEESVAQGKTEYVDLFAALLGKIEHALRAYKDVTEKGSNK